LSERSQREKSGKLVRNDAGLPRVQRGKDVHRILDDLDEALADPDTGDQRLYQRGGELVIARGLMAEDARRLRIKFAPRSIILCSLRSSSLIPRITEYLDYGYWGFEDKAAEDGTVQKRQVWKSDLPSTTVLAAFLSKVYWAHARPIRGVSLTPIIHLDGSIVSDGYDPVTEYLVASNVELPPIPDKPTEGDARTALAELLEPFGEFPFETEDERYSPVALALTILLRPIIRGNVPGFVQTAPQKNCGKSLATKGACLLATGQIPASNTWAKLSEEQEKMIGAAADSGAVALFFDNVAEGAVIGGAPLDKVLTCDGQNGFRVLGLTQLKSLPWGTIIVFTANRARVGGDTDRRVVVAVLVRPDVPRETFTHADLLQYIATARPRLLAAAFTLVRAWVQAKAPCNVKRLDTFEHWGQSVAAMIKWAGGGDVRALVRDEVGTETDGDEYVLLVGMHTWMTATGKRDFTVKELIDDLFGKQTVLGDAFEELRAVVGGIAGFDGKGEGRKLDGRRFGKRLARMKDLLQGGYRLKEAGEASGHTARWTVLRVGGVEGVRGVELDPTRGKKGVSNTTVAVCAAAVAGRAC